MSETNGPSFWKAFREAQMEMRDPVKDASNPHFKSRFVTLKGVLDAVRGPLHKNGIGLLQSMDGATVVTSLRHDDGSGIDSRTPVICAKPNDPQAFGSALTYARRYAVAAICGIAPADEDDDAEAAVDRAPVKKAPTPKAEAALPFDSPDHAVAAIEQSNIDALKSAVSARIKASNFKGADLDLVRTAYADRMQGLNHA